MKKRKLQSSDAPAKTTIVDFFSQPKRLSEEGKKEEEGNGVLSKEKQRKEELMDSVILIDSSDNDDIVSTIKRNPTRLMVEHPCGPTEMAGKEEASSQEEESVHFRGQKKRASLIDSEPSDSVIDASSDSSSSSSVIRRSIHERVAESISSSESVSSDESGDRERGVRDGSDESGESGDRERSESDSSDSDSDSSDSDSYDSDSTDDESDCERNETNSIESESSDSIHTANANASSNHPINNIDTEKEGINNNTEETNSDISIISIDSSEASTPKRHTSSPSTSESDDDQLRTILQENLNYEAPNVDTIIDSDSSMDCIPICLK